MADVVDNAKAIEGRDAHDAPATENPVVVGGVTQDVDDTAPGNQVSAEDDVAQAAIDRDGAFFAHPHPPRIWHVNQRHTAAQTDATVKAAPGAGLSLYITDIYLSADGPTTITLEEGTTTRIFEYEAGGTGDGVSHSMRVPIKLAANTLLSITTVVVANINVLICGFTAP